MWDMDGICAAAARVLGEHARRLDLEQSVRGIDCFDELALHPLLHAAFALEGYGVHAEQRYPAARGRERRSEGDRCDIVLTRDHGEHLLDPLAAGTLFGDRGVDPAEALWIEVKVVGQYALIDGICRPNPGYSGQLLGVVTSDLRKLACDSVVSRGALLLILFTADAETARHDIRAWHERAIVKGIRIATPYSREFPITDRLGNSLCSVVLAPVGAALM